MNEQPIDLTVIVRVVGGASFVPPCLERLLPQLAGRRAEVVVPFDATIPAVGALQPRFPTVRFIDMGAVPTDARPGSTGVLHELYDRRASAGLCAARGEIVALIEDYGAPDPDWCAELLAAHRLLPHGVIGGAVEHAGRGPLNWAIYFLDFARYALPLSEGDVDYLTDVNVSYKRAALEAVRPLWTQRYNEVTVHWAMQRQGIVLWRRPQIVVREDRGVLTLSRSLVERFFWGRLFAARRTSELSPVARLSYIATSLAIPLLLIGRIARKVFATGRHRSHFLRALPQIAATAWSWCLGEFVGYLTAREV